ncbi:MAG: cyclase family protein [Bacteroidota bacterium]
MRVIDLSRTVDKNMSGVNILPAKELRTDGWNATTLQLYSHSGTHVDAPIHFGVSDVTIDQMPLSDFYANAWIIDCEIKRPSALITTQHLDDKKAVVQKGDGLIFRTGWSNKYGTPAYRDELPRLSEELALWMVEIGIKMVGVEPPSVADVNNLREVTRIHKILLEGNVTIVEGLTNLEVLDHEKVILIALPLKIKNGDGCPARAVAVME